MTVCNALLLDDMFDYPRCSILLGYKKELMSRMSPNQLAEAQQLSGMR